MERCHSRATPRQPNITRQRPNLIAPPPSITEKASTGKRTSILPKHISTPTLLTGRQLMPTEVPRSRGRARRAQVGPSPDRQRKIQHQGPLAMAAPPAAGQSDSPESRSGAGRTQFVLSTGLRFHPNSLTPRCAPRPVLSATKVQHAGDPVSISATLHGRGFLHGRTGRAAEQSAAPVSNLASSCSVGRRCPYHLI